MGTKKVGLFERFGAARLAGWQVGAAGSAAAQPVHLLDDGERRAINRIQTFAVARAATAGALSALAAAVAEILVKPWEANDLVAFWAVVGGVTVVASVAEIGFLSWDALRSVAKLAGAAGIAVDDDAQRAEVVRSLARAALEVPDPIDSGIGVNPLRESSKMVLVVAALVYKIKVSATNMIIKLVVRRAMGRAAVRTWLPLLAIPGTAVWNAVVCAIVLREARVRIFGPSLVNDVVGRVLAPSRVISPALAEACARAVGSCIVRSAYLHPNLETLLRQVLERTSTGLPADVEDSRRFLEMLRTLPEADRQDALRLLTVAAVIDGKLLRRERRLLGEAAQAAGLPLDLAKVDEDRRRVRAGRPLAL